MEIKNASYIISAVEPSGYPVNNNKEYVFLGRSNVGKSSFINSLTKRKKLAYTSSKPGKTQTLNFYNIDDKIMFVDVPGYGYAIRTKEDRLKYGKMIEDYLQVRAALKLIFLIIDIKVGPTDDDILMYKFLKHYSFPVCVIATKADKIGKTLIYTQIKLAKNKLDLNNNDFLLPFSSLNNYGIEEIIKVLEKN